MVVAGTGCAVRFYGPGNGESIDSVWKLAQRKLILLSEHRAHTALLSDGLHRRIGENDSSVSSVALAASRRFITAVTRRIVNPQKPNAQRATTKHRSPQRAGPA